MGKEKEEYRLATQEHQYCLCCGAEISYGRTDKKFCNSHCKDTFHNRTKTHFLDVKSKVDHIMENNYRILNDMVKLGVSQISMTDLVAMGFNPSYSTSFSKGRDGMSLSCYDISFRISNLKIFNIRRISLTLRQSSTGK